MYDACCGNVHILAFLDTITEIRRKFVHASFILPQYTNTLPQCPTPIRYPITLLQIPYSKYPTPIPYPNTLPKYLTPIPYSKTLPQYPTPIPYPNTPAGSMRLQSPKATSLLRSECVSIRYLSTSCTGISSLPDRSLSSKFFANWYGLAVKASLVLVLYHAFFLVFSAFRRDFISVKTLSLNWESPGRSVGELCLYLRFSCLTSSIRFSMRDNRLLGFGGFLCTLSFSTPSIVFATEYTMVVQVCSFRFTGPCMAASRMMSNSLSNSFHDFSSCALGHMIIGFL